MVNLDVAACTVFYSYLRLHFYAYGDAPVTEAYLCFAAGSERLADQRTSIAATPEGGPTEIQIEALIRRADFPDNITLVLLQGRDASSHACSDLVAMERTKYAASLQPGFADDVRALAATGVRPKLLDIGGRARSGVLRSEHYPDCDVTVVDILPDKGVDIVADVHEMSAVLPPNSFDFAVSVSVFEHLLMPWKAALEINKVLKLGGRVLIHTHQTIGMHDMPWDYYRFSEDCWKGMFNADTGFTVEKTSMTDFMHVVPAHFYRAQPFSEHSGGFEGSSMIARKIGDTQLSWPTKVKDIVAGLYPE